MSEISEELLRKVIAGDMNAFKEVYDATSGFVYNIAWRILNNREDAQEVTQEVFVTVYKKLKDFQFASSFKTWIYRITVNQALNRAQQESKRKQRSTSFDVLSESEMMTATEETHESHIANDLDVENILKEISVDERACVILRSLEGLSYQEIAEALNININTVRTRLKRAREKLLVLKKKGHYEHL